jgi:outer membrane protein OmpA-like peptidoglycan-associated protein
MIRRQFFSDLTARLRLFSVPAASSAFLLLSPATSFADVEVDLSAIGLRSTADERIAPGRAPVQLRLPDSSPETRILLTPPPGVDRTVSAPSPAIAPAILAPANSQTIRPVSPAPAPTNRATIEQAAFPDPAKVAPAPLLPVVREPAARPETPQSLPVETTNQPQRPQPTLTPPAPAPNAPANVQTASLPAPTAASHHLRFEAGTADIPSETRTELEFVAAELMRHSDRIEIQAFAGVPNGLTSDARRLSLKRAIAVRKFLISQGVLQSRIDLRAMGGVQDNGPTERVDIILSSR